MFLQKFNEGKFCLSLSAVY